MITLKYISLKCLTSVKREVSVMWIQTIRPGVRYSLTVSYNLILMVSINEKIEEKTSMYLEYESWAMRIIHISYSVPSTHHYFIMKNTNREIIYLPQNTQPVRFRPRISSFASFALFCVLSSHPLLWYLIVTNYISVRVSVSLSSPRSSVFAVYKQ